MKKININQRGTPILTVLSWCRLGWPHQKIGSFQAPKNYGLKSVQLSIAHLIFHFDNSNRIFRINSATKKS